MDDVTDRMRASLKVAIRERDTAAAAALRSALAAIANAEAVDRAEPARPLIGLGAGEATRKELSGAAILEILRQEIADRAAAAEQYEKLGRIDEARRLRAESAALEPWL